MVGPLQASWLALAATLPVVELEDPASCVERPALEAALGQELPSDPALATLTLRVQVVTLPSRSDQVAPLQLSLRLLDADRAPILERSFEISAVDCPQLPKLVASVMARQLESLPRHAWARPRKQPISPAEAAASREAEEGLRLVEPQRQWIPVPPGGLRLALSLGAGLGVERQTLIQGPQLQLGTAHINTHLTASTTVDLDLWPELQLGVRVSAAQQQLGNGGVQIYTIRGLGGLTHDFDFESITVAPQLLLSGGLYAAGGVAFDHNYAVALPLAAAHARLVLYSKRVLCFWIEEEISFIRARLLERSSGASYIEPVLRTHAGIGLTLDYSFEEIAASRE